MKYALRIAGAVLLVVVAVAVYRQFWGQPNPIDYETVTVERKTVEGFVSATGGIESTTTVTVGSPVSGPVSEVLVDFNSPVERGQVLARIDPSEFEAQRQREAAALQSTQANLSTARANLMNQNALVEQAEVALVTARLTYQQTESTLAAAVAGVATARANLESRKIELENNLLQYQRAEDLVQRELVALSERDVARTNYLVSQAAVSTAEAALQQAQAQQSQTEAQVNGARNDIRAAEARIASAQAQREAVAAQVTASEASVTQAQASLSQVEVNLERTAIVSPISGVVIDRQVDEGQTVAAQFQAPELFTIARDLSRMQVKAEVSEADIGRVEEGAQVAFTVDAYPGRTFEGNVTQVRSAPDSTESQAASNVVVYAVMVSAENPENLLKPGMTATVEILAERLEDALMVPSQALRFVPRLGMPEGSSERGRRGPSGPRKGQTPTGDAPADEGSEETLEPGTRRGAVWVLANGKPERRDLVVGTSYADETVVLSGPLEPGEEVVLSESDGTTPSRGLRLRL